MKHKTLNEIISEAGIKTIRTGNKVELEHCGKKIVRPNHLAVYKTVEKEFNIDLKQFE